MNMVSYGVLGLGFTGRIHALNLLNMPNACLTAVADPDPKQFSLLEEEADAKDETELKNKLESVRYFKDPVELLSSSEVDALVICLPTHLHEEWVCSALAKGLHVMCEKPIALDCDAADRMQDAARKADRRFMVAHCIRFWPEYIYLRNAVAAGRHGRMLSLNLWRMSGTPAWSANQWLLDDALSGGPIVDLHIHDVDFALFLLGEPGEVQTMGSSSGNAKNPEVVHTLFRYEHGPQVHLHAGWSRAPIPFCAGFEAWFEKGFIRFSTGNDPSLELYETGSEEPVPVEIPQLDAYEEELRYFTGCIVTRSDPDICMPQSSRASLDMVLKILESART